MQLWRAVIGFLSAKGAISPHQAPSQHLLVAAAATGSPRRASSAPPRRPSCSRPPEEQRRPLWSRGRPRRWHGQSAPARASQQARRSWGGALRSPRLGKPRDRPPSRSKRAGGRGRGGRHASRWLWCLAKEMSLGRECRGKCCGANIA